MATYKALTIPLDEIERIEIFLNTAGHSIERVVRKTSADYAIPGTLYDMASGAVCCHLKAAGQVIACPADPPSVPGYSWDKGPDIRMDTVPATDAENYITCTPLIVSGKPLETLYFDPGQGGKRGRVAIGIKQGRLGLFVSLDGSQFTRDPYGLRDLLAGYGWESAIMLDGGRSAQGYFDGELVKNGKCRDVNHLVLIHLKKDKPAPDKDVGTTDGNDQKRTRVLTWAESQLGVIEFPFGSNRVKYNDWYYGAPGHNYAWCVTFVQWVMARAGMPLPIKTASCTQLANWAKAHGQWVTRGYKPGDIVMFHWGSDPKVTEHMGIVKAVNGTRLITVEGNTSTTDQSNGGCVMERTRALVSVTGAYRPWYNV